MIFCVTCGGALTGRFCARCGKDSQSATHLDVTSAARDDRGASPARYSAGKGGDRSRSQSRNKIDLRPGERSREREREQEREREKKREKQREREKERVRERPGISWEASLGPTQIQTVVPGAGGRAATSPEDLPAQAPLPSPVFDLSRLAANRGAHSRTHARPPARTHARMHARTHVPGANVPAWAVHAILGRRPLVIRAHACGVGLACRPRLPMSTAARRAPRKYAERAQDAGPERKPCEDA